MNKTISQSSTIKAAKLFFHSYINLRESTYYAGAIDSYELFEKFNIPEYCQVRMCGWHGNRVLKNTINNK